VLSDRIGPLKDVVHIFRVLKVGVAGIGVEFMIEVSGLQVGVKVGHAHDVAQGSAGSKDISLVLKLPEHAFDGSLNILEVVVI
jgi:hypothetical protein